MIRAFHELRERAKAHRHLAQQFLVVPLEETPQELALTAGLLDRRGKALVAPVVLSGPFIAARAIITHRDRIGCGLTLNNERAPAMEDKVVNLAHAGLAVVLGLLRINEAEIVEHQQRWLTGKLSMQIKRHLTLSFDARSNFGISRSRL